MRRRLTPLVFLAWLLAATMALAHSTHPSVSASREFAPATVTPGQSVTVTITVDIGSIGADPFRGFFLSDAVPSGLAPTAGSVELSGSSLSVTRESAPAGNTYPGCTQERWVLETPPNWTESNPVAAGTSLVVSYRVTVPADASPGEFTFPGFSWVGMVATQGDTGDHFGFEDAAAILTVEAVSDDLDGDGMPNDWETGHGLDPDNAADASEDPDSDGLTNLEEYHNDTDPNASDSDEDGMPDGWEVDNGLDPGSDDASADPDGDGYSNLQEYEGESDPQDENSIPGGGTNDPPGATCEADPLSGDAPLSVQFVGLGTDSDGTVAAYAWSFGNGETSTEQDPSHTYDQPGTYVAELTVTDDRGATGRDTVSILVFDPSGENPDVIVEGGCGCTTRGVRGMGLEGFLLALAWIGRKTIRRRGAR